jgi:hypothetical protein
MSSTYLKIGAALLASSALLAWQPAQACSTAAWTTVVGSATAGQADAGVRRYSGRCGLSAPMSPNSYVVESANHSNEGVSTPLRARFFVFPAVSGGTATLFQGLDGASNPVVQVHYNAATQQFQFQTPNGTGSTTGTAPASRWYRIELTYSAGQPMTASVIGNAGITYAVTGLPSAGAAGVDSVRLGAIAGTAAGTVFVDEYEASRSTDMGTSPFANVCRGDADGSGARNSTDALAVRNEFLSGGATLALGSPDCDENGSINSTDALCIRQIFLSGAGACPN